MEKDRTVFRIACSPVNGGGGMRITLPSADGKKMLWEFDRLVQGERMETGDVPFRITIADGKGGSAVYFCHAGELFSDVVSRWDDVLVELVMEGAKKPRSGEPKTVFAEWRVKTGERTVYLRPTWIDAKDYEQLLNTLDAYRTAEIGEDREYELFILDANDEGVRLRCGSYRSIREAISGADEARIKRLFV